MKRGILTLSKNEFDSLLNNIDICNIPDATLCNKLNAAKDTQVEEYRVEVSEEELEVLADEIGMPLDGDNDELKNAREKISQMILKFHSAT